MFLGDLNIHSIKNKFESVWEFIKDTFDIFLLSESKRDSSFPDNQLSILGYRIVRKDRVRMVEDFFCTSGRISPLK